MLGWDAIQLTPPAHPLLVTIEVKPEEIELAPAGDESLLRQKLLLALVALMTTDSAWTDPLITNEVPEALTWSPCLMGHRG